MNVAADFYTADYRAEPIRSHRGPHLRLIEPKSRGGNRIFSHMSPDLKQLWYLTERAFARMMGGLKPLGLPAKTLLARMIEYGVVGASQRGSIEVEDIPQDEHLFWQAFNVVCHTQILKSFYFAVHLDELDMRHHARRFGWSERKGNERIGELRRHMVTSLKTLGMRFNVDSGINV